MGSKIIQNSIPKKAISRPGVVSLIFFVIIVIMWVPLTLPFFINKPGVQGIFAIILAPLALVGLFLAYNSGIELAKYNYNYVVKGNLFLPYLVLVIIHIGCIGACLIHEMFFAGYPPFKVCFDYCHLVEMPTAIMAYSIVSTVLFLPAYCAIYRYRRWVVKYNLPKPV